MDNQTPAPDQDPAPGNVPAQNPIIAETPSSQVYTAPHIDNPPPKKPFLTGKIILIVIILSVILSAGGTYLALNSKPKPQPNVTQISPTPSPTPIDETANWKTYTNQKYGFSLKFPPSWRLTEDSSESAAFYPTSDPDLPSDNVSLFYDTRSFYPQPSPPSGMIPFTPITIAGTVGRQTQDDPKMLERVGGCTLMYQVELPVKSGTLVFGSCTSLMSDLQQFLSTFKFLDVSPTPTCRPRPACLDATPRCLIPETPDMCRPSATPPPGGGGIVCTQDAKLCPDGKTYVGRQGPNCEFVACPGQ